MADNIKPNSSITGASDVVTTQPVKTPGTYKGFDGKQYKLGLNEAIQADAADTNLQQQRALRKYQETQAASNLQQALLTIDRNALDAYKGIANNYAARGMQRSGGYGNADDKAYKAAQQDKLGEVQKVTNLIDTNKIADAGDQATRNQAIYGIIAQFLQTEAGKKLNEIKG
jgi:hypothetical protein